MIVLKVHKSWTYTRGMPLFRALILDGATYYLVLTLGFGLYTLATMNNEVGWRHVNYLI